MRIPLTLAWWILVLVSLEGASLLLDRSQHLPWGRIGSFLLKASYLAFACVLLLRFLSFRTRKPFEAMADAYRRISGQSGETPHKAGKGEWRKFLFYLALLLVASVNMLTPMTWDERTFKSSILLDLLLWMMTLRWVVRAFWLKSLGRREKLKEGLDDARSRLRQQTSSASLKEAVHAPGDVAAPEMTPFPAVSTDPGAVPPAGNRTWAFLLLFILALFTTLAVSAERWRAAARNVVVSDLKRCLLTCLDRALDRFHAEGRLVGGLSAESCLFRHREDVDIGMGFQRGELLLWAIEKPGRDYLGNGKPGDQGLMLDAEGRFRDTGGGR